MKKITLRNIPKEVIDGCLIYSQPMNDNVVVNIYHWCSTDRYTILWRKGKSVNLTRPVGRMDLHLNEMGGDINKLVNSLGCLTLMMEIRNWGCIDLRDKSYKRVFK